MKLATKYSRMLYFAGDAISKGMPSLKLNLFQSEMEIHPREYAALCLFSGLFYFLLLTPLTFAIGLVLTKKLEFVVPFATGAGFGIFIFMYLLSYPKFLGSQKIKSVERDLLGALQNMLIEVRSGVPLFNAMLSVTNGYGEVSVQFRKIISQVNTGVSEIAALDEASRRNPSLHFRRAMWQIINSIKSGSDVANALAVIVDTLEKEQVIAIRKYGQELNPYTMMYMLVAVIMPSLGITFLIIMSSFSGIVIPKLLFPAIIVGLVLFQIFYMGLIKTKRPALEI